MTFIAGQITSTGLVIAPLTGTSEAGLTGVLDYLEAQMNAIYGASIDFSSNTPDGQMLNIFAQVVEDVLQFLVQVNSSFDFTQAMGVILRERVAYMGIQANDATFSTLAVQVTVNGACTLYGLDQTIQPIYTIQDTNGNQWEVVNTTSFTTAGTYNVTVQAQNPGQVLVPANSITIPVTTVLQVTGVNNSAALTSASTGVGQNEEQDSYLRLRAQQSVALGSIAQTQGMIAALRNIPGIIYANVYENDTSTTNTNGIPGHSIWVVVQPGSATNEEIANAIYIKRGQGVGLYYTNSGTTYPITQPDGTVFIVGWDTLAAENVFAEFSVTGIAAATLPAVSQILSQLPQSFAPGVTLNVNTLATLIQAIDSNTLVTNAGFSTSSGGPFTNTISAASLTQYLAFTAATLIMTYTGTQNLSSFGGSASATQQIVASPYNPALTTPAPLVVPKTTTQVITLYGGLWTGLVGSYTKSFIVSGSGSPTFTFAAPYNTGTYTAGATGGGAFDIIEFQDTLGNVGYAVFQVTG